MSYGVFKYGSYKYGEVGLPGGIDVEDCDVDLIQYLPYYERSSLLMQEIMSIISDEICILYYHIEDFEQQISIDTSTWALSIYEKELGISTNSSLSYQERRDIIKSKWRGAGVATKTMIKETVEVFSGTEVEVMERPSEYSFVLKFIGTKGTPQNMQGVIDALESIKPAHLSCEFKYAYTIWNHLRELAWGESHNMTWNDLKTYEGDD